MAEPWRSLSIYALEVWIVLGLVGVFVLWYAWEQDRKYRRRYKMPAGFQGLLLAAIGTAVYPAAAWSAFLAIRHLHGLPRLEWQSIVSAPLLLIALSVPIGAAAVLIYQRLWYR
jgi:hypothetical protein